MPNATSSNAPQEMDRVDRVMSDKRIAEFIAGNAALDRRARDGAEWLVKEHHRATGGAGSCLGGGETW